jgi:energy-coupling factor transporter ATP-binding protein EcfA2
MLAIARALMSKPKLLLLDEPSLGLAPLIVQKIFEIIREINKAGATIFLVEQNAAMALKIAHRGYVLQTGHVILADQSEEPRGKSGRAKGVSGGVILFLFRTRKSPGRVLDWNIRNHDVLAPHFIDPDRLLGDANIRPQDDISCFGMKIRQLHVRQKTPTLWSAEEQRIQFGSLHFPLATTRSYIDVANDGNRQTRKRAAYVDVSSARHGNFRRHEIMRHQRFGTRDTS